MPPGRVKGSVRSRGVSYVYPTMFPGSDASAAVVVPLVADLLGGVRSVVDYGCGTGEWLAQWRQVGADRVAGVDGSYVDRDLLKIEEFHPADLAAQHDPLVGERFDLAMSVEVAEHLPADCADWLAATLTSHADVALFSAAIPHQGGNGHINEQWPGYWRDRFAAHGFALFDLLRGRLWEDTRVARWYRQNLFLYATGDAAAHLRDVPVVSPLAVVHPESWIDTALIEPPQPTLRQAVRALPRATGDAIRWRLRNSRRVH